MAAVGTVPDNTGYEILPDTGYEILPDTGYRSVPDTGSNEIPDFWPDTWYSRRQLYAYRLAAYFALLHRFVSVPIF